MAAYAAANSLKNTIQHILHSSRIILVPPSPEIIQLAYNELQPLQETLKRLDGTRKNMSRKKVNALDGRIRETLQNFEDLLEFLLFDQIISQFQSPPHQLKSRRRLVASQSTSSGGGEEVFSFSIDLQRLANDVDSFIQTIKLMEKEYIYELGNMVEDEADECISSRAGFDGTKSKMIGFLDEFEQVKRRLMRVSENEIYTLVGMAGVGKTTLAKEVFEDPKILSYFDHCAWVTVGRIPQLHQVSQSVLAQLYGIAQGDEEKGDYVKETLEGKKCLIVLDDIWEAEVLESLMNSLPQIRDGETKVLLTTRDRMVIINNGRLGSDSRYLLVPFLNDEESKHLLCEKVFGESFCPPQLDKAATKIAKKCEGLPLTIVTIAGILSEAQNTDPEYWDDVAEERNSVFTDAYIEISKVLFPSYEYLSQDLKMLFLYMGVFPPDYETPISRITHMLTVEGWFHETNTNRFFKGFVLQCLRDLCVWKYVLLFKLQSIAWYGKGGFFGYKSCRLHSSWRHLCRGEARKNKFFHVLIKLVDVFEQGIKGQRCLCLQNNLLFGIKEFYDSVRNNCASSTRSLLFFGPYHPYPVPIDVGFKLLRELDALQLRFYIFPVEILTLVQLKYLALSYNGELPSTLSKLFNLKILIIHPHINIRYCRAPSYTPIQVWDMKELEHVEILGKNLGAPKFVASLEKLTTLIGVNANIATILELYKRIPSIRKLDVQIELMPYDDHSDLLSCFGCISTLESLETLKCSIVNPVVKNSYVVNPAPNTLMLPHGLIKLHLSGMGFPWEYMDVVGCLPCLKVLKLRSYAFRGPKWEPQEGSFECLRFLLIEDSDLVQWKPRSGSFPELTYLSIKHCYKLQQLHYPLTSFYNKIELVDSNPSVVITCSEELPKKAFLISSSF